MMGEVFEAAKRRKWNDLLRFARGKQIDFEATEPDDKSDPKWTIRDYTTIHAFYLAHTKQWDRLFWFIYYDLVLPEATRNFCNQPKSIRELIAPWIKDMVENTHNDNNDLRLYILLTKKFVSSDAIYKHVCDFAEAGNWEGIPHMLSRDLFVVNAQTCDGRNLFDICVEQRRKAKEFSQQREWSTRLFLLKYNYGADRDIPDFRAHYSSRSFLPSFQDPFSSPLGARVDFGDESLSARGLVPEEQRESDPAPSGLCHYGLSFWFL